jgi:hypothetical protein
MDCSLIKRGAAYDCANPLQGGAEPNVVLFNKQHIVGTTKGSVPNEIAAITLASQASGYLFYGFGRSVVPSLEVIKQNSGQNTVKHQVILSIFDRSQVAKNTIQNLLLGKFVAAIESAQKDANTFEMYGMNAGLSLMPGSIQQMNVDNGAFIVTLATPDGEGESKLPVTFYDGTSYATSKALLYGYCFLPTITSLNDYVWPAAGGDSVTVTGTNFYGSIASNDVEELAVVKKNTEAVTTLTHTVASATSITFTSPVLSAGIYNLRVKTSKGYATLSNNITVTP